MKNNNYLRGGQVGFCGVSAGNDYACLKGNSLKDSKIPLQNLGGDLCLDEESCNTKLEEMGFGHCKDKKLMVYAEKCGAFDIGCKK
jgi:hypothetical protein